MTALKHFAAAGLLENGADVPNVNFYRRRMLVGFGLATPVILMIIAPSAASAASCVVAGSCNPAQTCCSTNEACPIATLTCPP